MAVHFREHIVVPEDAQKQIRRIGPILLIFILLAYLLLGASTFLFLEHTNHERYVRKFYLNLAVNRRQYARQVSQKLFNDTKNLFVVIDRDQSERVQAELVNAIKEYEHRINIITPSQNEWTFWNSWCYSWGLLTTVGHGDRSPKTTAGQIFALIYAMLGVPYYFGTIAILAYRAFAYFKDSYEASKHRTSLLIFGISLYGTWLVLFTLVLYWNAIPESFWRALYTAVLTSLTVQTFDYNKLTESEKLLALTGTTISLLIAFVLIFFVAGYYSRKDKVATDETVPDGQKFQVVVDESGETKISETDKMLHH